MTKHYLWNYIFYIYGLNKKDSTEYTGLEYAISDMIAKEDIQWYFNHLPTRFPMKQSDNSMVENIEILTKRIENLEMSMA
jgi:inositol 1,4,5-triphosphate receptor type 1/inositol 1,4,5-triphosphate receptor type 3